VPWPTTPPTAAHRAAYRDAEPRPFWTHPQTPCPALTERTEADLCIVGAGFTGLWAALYAKELDPGRDVVVLEGETAGFGASGRNGGFAVASLTHGLDNGLARFAEEMPALERLALENFEQLQADLASHRIDCDFEATGELLALTDDHQLPWLHDETLTRFGHEVTVFDQAAMRAEVHSPTYIGGVWDRTGAGILDPGKLAAGMRDAAIRAGVRVYEHSVVHHVGDHVLTAQGRVRARKVLLATSAYPSLHKPIGRYVVPVYDYVLVTEPIATDVLGWRRRQGIGDAGNQFHYYRLTRDDRILFGGWDAV
jgi:glycine/D-amino acid oxidase-like deaminating enzyme